MRCLSTYLYRYHFIHNFMYGTVQAQVYTRARVKRRALAWRDVRVFRVLDKAFTREAHTCCNLSPFACIAASL